MTRCYRAHPMDDAQGPQRSDAVSRGILYIIAGMIALCTLVVLAFKGIKAMPFDWIGLVGAIVLAAVSLALTRLPHPHADH